MLDKRFEDFRVFLAHVWKHLHLPPPTPYQNKIADVVQNVIKASGAVPLPPSPTFRKRYRMLLDDNGQITKKIIVEAFRGVGKSWVDATIADWCLGWNDQLNILSLSAAKQKSDEFTKFCLDVLSIVPELNYLLPDKRLGDRCSSAAFDVRGHGASQSPSIRSSGIFGMITGSRADIAFLDDIEVPKTSETQLLREKLITKTVEVGGAIVKPETGVVIYLGTPQCEETIYDKLLAKGYRKIILPARYPSDKYISKFGSYLEPSILHAIARDPSIQSGCGLDGTLGRPTDTRFTESILKEREAEYGRSDFARQFMLDTSLTDAERYPLRLRDLVVMDVGMKVPAKILWCSDPDMALPDEEHGGVPCVGIHGDRFYRPLNFKVKQGEDIEWLKLSQAAMYIDPAGRGADELSLAVGYTVDGYIFVKKVKGFLAGYEKENLIEIAKIAKLLGVNEITTEPNFGDGMFNELLAPVLRDIYPCSLIESEWSSTQKEKRIIETLEPVMNQHLLVIDPEVIRDDIIPHPNDSPEKTKQRMLFYQMTRITHEKDSLKYDDRLDAVAGLVNYFMKNLGIDQHRTAQERKDERFKEYLKDRMFRKDKSNGVDRKPSWVTMYNIRNSSNFKEKQIW